MDAKHVMVKNIKQQARLAPLSSPDFDDWQTMLFVDYGKHGLAIAIDTVVEDDDEEIEEYFYSTILPDLLEDLPAKIDGIEDEQEVLAIGLAVSTGQVLSVYATDGKTPYEFCAPIDHIGKRKRPVLGKWAEGVSAVQETYKSALERLMTEVGEENNDAPDDPRDEASR